LFFEGKKAVFPKRLWQEQNGIIFQATSGISPIDAIRENSSSNFQRIGIGICNGCIEPGLTLLMQPTQKATQLISLVRQVRIGQQLIA